jgi:NTE family protein
VKLQVTGQPAHPARKKPRPHLRPDQIKYLAFEGGGGKGFAYIGALEELEDKKVLEFTDEPGGFHKLKPKIRGIAGASAGAITALLVSCGYNSTRIREWMKKTRFEGFFDPPDPREVVGPFAEHMSLEGYPTYKRGYLGESNSVTYVKTSSGEEYREPDGRAARSMQAPAVKHPSQGSDYKKVLQDLVLGVASPSYYFANKAVPLLRDAVEIELIKLAQILVAYELSDAPAARDALNEARLKKYVDYMGEDMGMFSGCYARRVFAQVLADSMPEGPMGPQFEATFQEHYDYFKTDLVLMGTNLATQKSWEFSAAKTPGFPVADAVRISMGIPMAFKPVVIPSGTLEGVWVDGGVANNAPFRVFDHEPGENPKTLVLRLDKDPDPQKIEGLFSFLKGYASFSFLGAGEAQINEQYASQAISIDTGRLSLLNFKPEPTMANQAVANAKQATRNYFAQGKMAFAP